jgi:hypothetical protein
MVVEIFQENALVKHRIPVVGMQQVHALVLENSSARLTKHEGCAPRLLMVCGGF